MVIRANLRNPWKTSLFYYKGRSEVCGLPRYYFSWQHAEQPSLIRDSRWVNGTFQSRTMQGLKSLHPLISSSSQSSRTGCRIWMMQGDDIFVSLSHIYQNNLFFQLFGTSESSSDYREEWGHSPCPLARGKKSISWKHRHFYGVCPLGRWMWAHPPHSPFKQSTRWHCTPQ